MAVPPSGATSVFLPGKGRKAKERGSFSCDILLSILKGSPPRDFGLHITGLRVTPAIGIYFPTSIPEEYWKWILRSQFVLSLHTEEKFANNVNTSNGEYL